MNGIMVMMMNETDMWVWLLRVEAVFYAIFASMIVLGMILGLVDRPFGVPIVVIFIAISLTHFDLFRKEERDES